MNSKEIITQIKNKYQSNNLVDMVHDYLIEKDKLNQEKRVNEGRTGKFYPSSVGQCHRKVVYDLLGYKGKDKTGKELLTLENGTYFHERMETIFNEMGIMISPELSLKDEELRISGRSDAIIHNFLLEDDEPDGPIITLTNPKGEVVYEGPNNHVLIVEFKSASSNSYDKYTPKKKPQIKHELQLQLYFYLTGIDKGMIYYENKNNQSEKYFIVERNDEMIKDLIEEITYLIKMSDEGKLPPRQFDIDSFECRYCPFIDYCYPPQNNMDIDDLLSMLD